MKKLDFKLVVGLVLVSVIATSAIWYVWAATPTSTIWISPGIYPGAPSYTIWKEGSNYFAKDANGQIDYSDTDAAIVIQATNDALPNGGKILLSQGTFILKSSQMIGVANHNTSLIISDNIEIEGHGTSTVITQDNGLNLNYFITNEGHNPGGSSVHNTGIKIKNINFDGNYDNQDYADDANCAACPLCMLVDYSTFENIRADNYGMYGVITLYGHHNKLTNIHGENGQRKPSYRYASVVFVSASVSKNNQLVSISGKNNEGAVLFFEDNAYYNEATNVVEENCRGAVYISYGSGNTISNVYSYNSSGNAINMIGDDNTIIGVYINYSEYVGIRNEGLRNKVIGGTVKSCGRTGDATGIMLIGGAGTGGAEIIGVDTYDDLGTPVQTIGIVVSMNDTRIIGGYHNNHHGIQVLNAFNTIIFGIRAAGNSGVGVDESGTSDYTFLHGNNLLGNGTPHTVDAANSVVADNIVP